MSTATAAAAVTADAVLFVDDEPHVLEGIARSLRNRFEIHTAVGGAEGLRALEKNTPFAVVVSDMRMPDMDGVQFLTRVRDRAPDTVRMVLSGHADLASAIAAVNEGNIFRFLSKPCTTQQLAAAVGTGIEQYRLINAEKILLEQTLSGAVSMLLEILGVVMPSAHGRAQRLRQYVTDLARTLNLRERWQWPLAAQLSQIGCVSLPKDTLSKIEAGQPLSEEEQSLNDSHPRLAARMLQSIPRLEDVAAIVAAQEAPLNGVDPAQDPQFWDVQTAGIVLLRVVNGFDRLAANGVASAAIAEQIRTSLPCLPKAVIDALKCLQPSGRNHVIKAVRLLDLAAGMRLDEAIITQRGACLVPAGHEVTPGLLLRLKSIAAGVHLKEPFRVQVPV